MKTILFLLLVTASALAQTSLDTNRPAGSGALAARTYIAGVVLQRTDQGLLIQTRKRGDDGLVWLIGRDAKTGTKLSIPATLVGTKSYCALDGASTMLDLYDATK